MYSKNLLMEKRNSGIEITVRHAPSVVFNVDFQIAMRRVANRTDLQRLVTNGDKSIAAAFPAFHLIVSNHCFKITTVILLSGSLQQLSS